ncbi:MAG: hypothetical protein OXE84_10295 [Rhodobacteraceae bacterium]|nr:hypothetical protein [Paracoccaceae bacterium]MCY4196766.1 hypothetical protein [Paracoccaceae bacterium]MCY4328066.1 hypothetical protein [Paracoccaceae bacterium]
MPAQVRPDTVPVTYPDWVWRMKKDCEQRGIPVFLTPLEWLEELAAPLSPLDESAVKAEIVRLEITKGTERADRPPTREDIFARWHWRYGTDAPDPLTTPLERQESYPPMPLAWFDSAAARKRLRDPDPQHHFLDWMSACYLAGYTPKLSGADVFRIFTKGAQTDTERSLFYEMLTGADETDYPLMRIESGLSIRDIARGVLQSGTRVGALSWWLNQWAEKPETWPSDRPLPAIRCGGFWPHRHKDGEFWPLDDSQG